MPRAKDAPLPGAPEPWTGSQMPAFRARPPYAMSQMIAAEPALAERLINRLARDEALDSLASAISDAASSGRAIITTGCGTSEHAAMGIAELLNEALAPDAGNEVRALEALASQRRRISGGLLIAVSHEGGTPATNEAIRSARAAGARTALITAGRGSPGAQLAEIVVATEEQDQSWCHTVGYLSPLIVGVVTAARIARTRPDALAVRALLDVGDDPHAAASTAAALAGVDRLLVVGSGPDQVSARELALKVAEGARLPAAAHEVETILHGHLAAANRWSGLVLLLTDPDPAAQPVHARAGQVLAAAAALNVPSAAIVAESLAGEIGPELTPAGRIVLPHTGRVRGVAGSLLGSAIALQVLAERMARARGVNPDTLGREDPTQAAAHA